MSMIALGLAASAAAIAPADPPRQILEQAVEAMGGDHWLNPSTLELEGSATFYAPNSAVPRSTANDYRMWRAMDPKRTVSHGADGKVRITARHQGRLLFDIGYDGDTTWTDKGVMPKAEADAYWASNFGFGIIRKALSTGFTLERAPDRNVEGKDVAMIRVIGPDGARTLFGIDRSSRLVRYMAFASPRGFHERVYDDFLTTAKPRWVQARRVTLYYDGIKANEVHWSKVRINAPLVSSRFAPPKAPAEGGR